MSYHGLGQDEEVPEQPPDWKQLSPLDDDADAAVARFIETGELDTDMIKGAAQTYVASMAASGCAALTAPAGPLAAVAGAACGYAASWVVGKAWDIAESVVNDIAGWFSADPPPPALIELGDMPDECVSLNWAWSYVQGSLAQGRRGIYAEMIHGLMRLKQQLRIPGAYDWPAVTERLRTEYGVRLIPMDGYTFMGDSWAWAQGWSLVNAAGQVCTGGTCFWRAPKPEGLGNVIWRDIPRNQQVAPPMLADGYTIEDNRVVLQQGYRLCSNIPADWNRVTAANCIYCRENAEEWLSSFLAAVTAETAWLYTIAELQRALTQAQYEQGVALQTAYVEGAAAYQAATTEYEANREARHTAYLLLLIEFLGLTPAAQGQTRSAVDLMIQDALQERGLSAQTVLSWISYCEPPYPPTWDPVECFRAGIERWRVEYPSRGLSAQDVFNLQLLLNPILQLLGYQPIAENGVLDGRVCGAVELVNAGVDRLEHSEHAARWHAAWSYAGGIVTEACAEVPTPWEAPLTQPGVVPLVSPRVALGPKARAQIAIVALGLAALGGAAWWFLRKRRR